MKVSQLTNFLRDSQEKNVYLVAGSDNYQIDQAKEIFINQIPKEEKEFNVGIYDMEITPLSVALEDANSAPFFGDKRLVLINNPYFLTGEAKKNSIEHNVDELIEYLTNPALDTIFVILANYDKLDSRKKIVKQLKTKAIMIDAKPLNENEIRMQVNQLCQNKGCQIDKDAIDQLLYLTDNNFTKVMNEMKKLLINAIQDKVITLEMVDNLVNKSLEQNVFDLVEFVLEKNIDAALELYHELIEQKEEPIMINAILISQFRLLLQVKILQKHGYAQGNIAEALRVHPYRVKLAMKNARRFNYEDVRHAYLGLEKNEEDLKSANVNPELLFQLFLFKFIEK